MKLLTGIIVFLLFIQCTMSSSNSVSEAYSTSAKVSLDTISPHSLEKLVLTDSEWREKLSSQEYEVLRSKGTERSFSGELLNEKREGVFMCKACSLPLFSSDTKFKSGSGWPSFYDEVGEGNVVEITDGSYGWSRTEIVCGRCDGHLGHVFKDGPKPTGLRYCVNSVSLEFKEVKENK